MDISLRDKFSLTFSQQSDCKQMRIICQQRCIRLPRKYKEHECIILEDCFLSCLGYLCLGFVLWTHVCNKREVLSLIVFPRPFLAFLLTLLFHTGSEQIFVFYSALCTEHHTFWGFNFRKLYLIKSCSFYWLDLEFFKEFV